ncbi:MAG: hypothetical protein DRI26_02185 [Chloroflexi bacterium]|nr:MAG: hypothetical protein DRI26_02185 [Chloroflexota bacterium]
MNKHLILLLVAGTVLLTLLLFNAPRHKPSKPIEMIEADTSLAIGLRPSRDLEISIAEVLPPVIVQDSSGIYVLNLWVSRELTAATDGVNATVLVGHAAGTYARVLMGSAGLKAAASDVAPGVLFEHASGVYAEALKIPQGLVGTLEKGVPNLAYRACIQRPWDELIQGHRS